MLTLEIKRITKNAMSEVIPNYSTLTTKYMDIDEINIEKTFGSNIRLILKGKEGKSMAISVDQQHEPSFVIKLENDND